MSFRVFRGCTLTTFRAGLALNITSSLVKGLIPLRAGTAGYLSQTSVLYGPDGHAYSVSHQTVGVYG